MKRKAIAPVHLELDRENFYRIVDEDLCVALQDPWNAKSGRLSRPRFPRTEEVWAPTAVRRLQASSGYGLYLQNQENRHVIEWQVSEGGRYESQRPATERELFDHAESGRSLMTPEQIEWAYWTGYQREARRLALLNLRNKGWSDELANFLIVQHHAGNRPSRARWLMRARSSRSQRPLADPLLQDTGLGGPEHNYFVGLKTKQVLYLVQTEGLLDAGLAEALTSTHSDYLCLTFRTRIWKPNYVFVPNSTWTGGRNVLFETARRSFPDYDFYVFCDDDLTFAPNPTRDAVDQFNRWLLGSRPEIGVAATPWHNQWGRFYSPEQPTTRVTGFDALFNAFRNDVFFGGILFPYIESFDHISWWTSQYIALELCARYYIAMQLNSLSVDSTLDRPYPRNPIPGHHASALVFLLTTVHLDDDWADESKSDDAGLRQRRRLRFNKEARDRIYRSKLFDYPGPLSG